MNDETPENDTAASLILADDLLDSPPALRRLLRTAYGRLDSGAILHASLLVGDRTPAWRDIVGTALYAEGFEKPRYVGDGQGAISITARRSTAPPPYERTQRLSVVMPVFNEQATFGEVLDAVLAKRVPGIDIEVIVVESNSTDGTRDKVLAYANHDRVRLVLEDRPGGKGHAVRAGLAEATGDFILIQDADLEYDLDDYDALLRPLQQFEASFVLGIRTRTDGARFGVRHFDGQVLVSRIMNVGNALFLALFNLAYHSRLRDPFTMYKVFRRDCIHRMILESNRFDFDWELTAKLLRSGYRPLEIPVSYQSRGFSEGKKISVIADPISWVRACWKYRTAPLEEA